MSAQYRFFLREADGTGLAWIPPEAWIYFGYTRRVNDMGRFEGGISLVQYPQFNQYFDVEPGGHLDAILEVWRSVDFSPAQFYLEQQFFCRYRRNEYLNDGRLRMTCIGRTIEYLLSSCNVYPDNVNPPNLPQEGDEPADFYAAFPWPLPAIPNFTGVPLTAVGSDTADKMAALVEWSQISNPIALVNVTIPAAPAGGIPAHYLAERNTNLLKSLQDASAASWFASFNGLSGTGADQGCDFRLTPAVAAPYLPWTFDVRVGQWGTDHRASSASPVIFSPEKNNMLQPVSLTDRLEEKTAVIVGGDGQDAARNILIVVDNARIADSIYNKREMYADSRKIDAFAAVPPPRGIEQATEFGQANLKEHGIRRQNTFIAIQQPGCQYGVDYNLGDLVTSQFLDSNDYQIRQVEINYSNSGGETVTVEFGSLDGTFSKGNDLYQQMMSLIKDIQTEATDEAAGT